jgi:hypothetical protein
MPIWQGSSTGPLDASQLVSQVAEVKAFFSALNSRDLGKFAFKTDRIKTTHKSYNHSYLSEKKKESQHSTEKLKF